MLLPEPLAPTMPTFWNPSAASVTPSSALNPGYEKPTPSSPRSALACQAGSGSSAGGSSGASTSAWMDASAFLPSSEAW